ncbi:MAG TPA: conjugative transposon protein TraM [Sphingobacteriaceae bacterium]
MTTQLSHAAHRQSKFLLVLPVLVLPFMTMAFWALGGGRTPEKMLTGPQQGLDIHLPEAQFKPGEKQDKFSVYETLAKQMDSGRMEAGKLAFSSLTEETAGRQEQRIEEKLNRIRAELEKPAEPAPRPAGARKRSSVNLDPDVARLESLIRTIQNPGDEDPEIRQLDAVLDKILEVQDPGRKMEKGRAEPRSSGRLFRVLVADSAESGQAVRAVIHQDQTVISGSVIRLRLLEGIYVGKTLVPENELVYGEVTVDGERLKIGISSVRFGNAILPVALDAFDLDGLEGLYAPGALTRDAIKNGADDALQRLQLTTLDPSLSAQVAGAGLQAAKGLFRKKARQVRVKVRAGYQLLLRDRNQGI